MNIITNEFRNAELNDVAWLDQMYSIDEKRVGDIANILGCSSCTVGKALTKHGITRRNYRTQSEKANMSGPRPSVRGENNPMFGGTHTPAAKEKMSVARRKEVDEWIETEQSKHRLCVCGCGKEIVIQRWHFSKGIPECIGGHVSNETKKKLSDMRKGPNNPLRGRAHSDEHRQKNSEAHIGLQVGEKNHQWKGGISFEPYCNKFNDAHKESIRNQYDRKCFLCGISEEDQMKNQRENGKRTYKLDIHHIDFNKKQGCDDINWKLVPLCRSCHGWTSRNRDLSQEIIESQLTDRLSTGMVV